MKIFQKATKSLENINIVLMLMRFVKFIQNTIKKFSNNHGVDTFNLKHRVELTKAGRQSVITAQLRWLHLAKISLSREKNVPIARVPEKVAGLRFHFPQQHQSLKRSEKYSNDNYCIFNCRPSNDNAPKIEARDPRGLSGSLSRFVC